MEYFSTIKLDAVDLAILNMLQQDSKVKNKEIAAELGLTITPIYERIKRLEREGIIKQYVTLLEYNKVGKELIGFCMVTLEKHAHSFLKDFENSVAQIPDVMECFHLAGQYDYFLKVLVEDMNAYQDFVVNKLSVIKNVGQVHSSFALSVIKSTTAIKL